MKIYQLCMSYELEDDVVYDIEYIAHDKEFSKDEFIKMCEEAFDKYNEKTNYVAKLHLKEVYGFYNLPIMASIDFAEE